MGSAQAYAGRAPGAVPGAALGPLDVSLRLARLEAVATAHRIAREAEPLGRWLADGVARAENRLIAHFLLRGVRAALADSHDPPAVAARLARYRAATAAGRYGFFKPVGLASDAPPSEDSGYGSAALAHEPDYLPDSAPDDPAPQGRDPLLLYVPGGGFILPPSPAQVALAFRLAEACGCEAVIGKHRLAPEHPFPAPVHDLADHYARLLAQGQPARRVLLAGDSAGATLVLSMLVELRARRLPMPAGVLLFSPWTDLAMRGWSYITKSMSNDSPFRMETAAFAARLYLGQALPTDPRASPAYADLAGLPPMVIHCSRFDMHFDDAVHLAERAEAAGVPVRMHYWESPRHHLERFRSKDAARSLALAGECARALLAGQRGG